MRTLVGLLVPLICCFAFTRALAAPTTFENKGLKWVIVVALDVNGETATGNYKTHEYDPDSAGPGTPFKGKVIPTPKGKEGIYLEIKFDGKVPYTAPPGAKKLIWHLTIVDHRVHLFIPMQERSYEGNTHWVVDDVELEPVD